MTNYDPAYTAPPTQPARPPQGNGFAVTSLVLGIVSFIPITGWVTAPLAVIFGSLRLRKGSTGRGMAIAGFVLGVVFTLVRVAVIIALAVHR